jgi:antitoxin Xre/MbcA/ParS-like protein
MPEKPKSTTRDQVRRVAQVLKDVDSSDPLKRASAIAECGDLAPYLGAVLAALLRGLNDPDDIVRLKAFQGLPRAFPSAEKILIKLLSSVESEDPKVRLAAISQVITILPQVLAVLSGMTPDGSAGDLNQPVPVMEDLVEYPGRWVAWTRDRQRVLAVADSFADVINQANQSGESDPYVKKVPGVSPQSARKPFAILQDESSNIVEDVSKVVPDADVWLNSPNSSLGGERPRDLIGTESEREVRYLLRGIRDGITT